MGLNGFHDGFNQTDGWYDEVYMGLNQAQIVVGIENHRSGPRLAGIHGEPRNRPDVQAVGTPPKRRSRKPAAGTPFPEKVTGIRPLISPFL